MTHTLIRRADTLLTMDDDRRELSGVDIRLRGGQVAEIGNDLPLDGAEQVLAEGCVVTQGWSIHTTTCTKP